MAKKLDVVMADTAEELPVATAVEIHDALQAGKNLPLAISFEKCESSLLESEADMATACNECTSTVVVSEANVVEVLDELIVGNTEIESELDSIEPVLFATIVGMPEVPETAIQLTPEQPAKEALALS